MIYRDLTNNEIESVLHHECYGHLGFLNEGGDICVLPITYVYHDGKIYSIAEEGEKVRSMRKNPNVCLQVQQIDLPHAWSSVQLWGTYSELEKTEADALSTLIADFWHRFSKEYNIFSPIRDLGKSDSHPNVIYSIDIAKTVGKFGGHEK